MIRSLIIGTEEEIQPYCSIIEESNYFGAFDTKVLLPQQPFIFEEDLKLYDAIFITQARLNKDPLFELLLKSNCNIFISDQSNFSNKTISKLHKIFLESGTLVFPYIPLLNHPLLTEFLITNSNHLLFAYNESIPFKTDLRFSILSALALITLLSPMQVKKISINTLDLTEHGQPTFKFRLRLFDSSLAYINITIENTKHHTIKIETRNGKFSFNLIENYIENSTGNKFICDLLSPTDLLKSSINQFAMHIILGTKPKFDFTLYKLSFNTLSKIENILKNTF